MIQTETIYIKMSVNVKECFEYTISLVKECGMVSTDNGNVKSVKYFS